MTTPWYKRARSVMREKNITQQQLADHMKKSRGGIGHWLTGRREPSMEEAQKISAFLQVSYGWLFASEGEREPGFTPSSLSEPVTLGEEPVDFEWLMQKATPRTQTELRRIINAAVEGRLTESDVIAIAAIVDRITEREPSKS
ncbi:MAG: helix-turn-helix transcriptional regulator [Algiphilus sp.]